MATLTLGNVGQPEAVHAGDNVLLCKISLSVSVSSGDIHIIGRLPHGAIPLDAVFYPGSAYISTSTGTVFKMGTSASPEMFFASATYSYTPAVATRTTRILGPAVQISLSDDFMPRYENVVAVNTGTLWSVGFVGALIVWYKMPGQTL